MEEIDEHDMHLCLRCNTHINGLDNYVEHRSSACYRQQVIQLPTPDTPPPSSRPMTVLQPELLQSATLNPTPLWLTSSKVLLRSSPDATSSSLHDAETSEATDYIKTCIGSRESVCEQMLHDIEENKETEQGTQEPFERYYLREGIETEKDVKELVEGHDIEEGIDTERDVKELVEGRDIEEGIDTERDVKELVEGRDIEEGIDTERDVKELVEGCDKEAAIETERDVKELVEGSSGSDDTIITTDAPECSEAATEDYSRYIEAKLLGNVPVVSFRQKRAKAVGNGKKLRTKEDDDFKLSAVDTMCKDESSEDDFRVTRKRNYRKKKIVTKNVNEGKKNESCDVSDIGGNQDNEKLKGERKSNASVADAKQANPKLTKTWTCPVCAKVMRPRNERVHMRIHSNFKPFKCHLCTYASKTHSDMMIHIKRHLGIKEFKCTECDYATPKRSLLKKHIHRHQREKGLEEMQYQCDECGKRYTTLDGLKLHIRAVHENIKPFRCSFDNCRYAAVSNSELEIHIRTHTKEKPFLCTLCGYKAGNKNRLRKHMITHTDETPFRCDYPGCAFAGKTAFRVKRHKKQHDPSNRLSCPYCSYTTFYLGNLRKHIKNTGKHKDTKVYLCDICKMFNTDVYKDLIDHYEKAHKGAVDVTMHSGGLKLGQFSHSRQQDESVEETIIIIPEEAIVIADNVEFTL